MTEEIKEQFTGDWIHTQDDHLPPFFDAVGAMSEEKQYMLTSTPTLTFSVDGDNVHTCNTPNPGPQPDIKADIDFKLDEEFKFQTEGHLLQITVQWKDGKMIQNINPIQSHTAAHTIELHVDKGGDLVQTYKTIDTEGNEVKGTRRYKKAS